MSNPKTKIITELDRIFSIIIRKMFADLDGFVRCCSCGVIKHWGQMTCGHYRKRRHMTVRWFIKNAGPQCETCNCEDKDESMELFLKEQYGDGIIDELISMSNKESHFTLDQLQKKKEELSSML